LGTGFGAVTFTGALDSLIVEAAQQAPTTSAGVSTARTAGRRHRSAESKAQWREHLREGTAARRQDHAGTGDDDADARMVGGTACFPRHPRVTAARKSLPPSPSSSTS
jgi:hypothetical protein